jgi:predicted cobalt transporter CbtA
MQKMLLRAALVGLVAGLLVGAYHNVFTVPVIERAIVLEEERAAASAPLGAQGQEEEPPLVSLGVQRIGMAVGTGIYGAILGLVFAGTFALLRRVLPRWSPVLLAVMAGVLGFWAISLLPFIKYPLVPPGVGEEDSLFFRQGFQTAFFFLSALGVVGLLLALNEIRASVYSESRRRQLYAVAALVYGAFLVALFLLLPGNPDPVAVPGDLLFQFRAFTIIGQFLIWALIAAGFAWLLTRSWGLGTRG